VGVIVNKAPDAGPRGDIGYRDASRVLARFRRFQAHGRERIILGVGTSREDLR
jgi:hypothetical protein